MKVSISHAEIIDAEHGDIRATATWNPLPPSKGASMRWRHAGVRGRGGGLLCCPYFVTLDIIGCEWTVFTERSVQLCGRSVPPQPPLDMRFLWNKRCDMEDVSILGREAQKIAVRGRVHAALPHVSPWWRYLLPCCSTRHLISHYHYSLGRRRKAPFTSYCALIYYPQPCSLFPLQLSPHHLNGSKLGRALNFNRKSQSDILSKPCKSCALFSWSLAGGWSLL